MERLPGEIQFLDSKDEHSELPKTPTSTTPSIKNGRWSFFGHKAPKAQITYICQVIILYVVIITSIINLSIKEKDGKETLWVSLLCSVMGYLLPAPDYKSFKLSDTTPHK